MLQGLTGWHAVIILAIILLLFGAPKLPALARSLGQSMKIFKSEIKTPKDEDEGAQGGSLPNATVSGDTRPSAATPVDESAPGSQTQPKP